MKTVAIFLSAYILLLTAMPAIPFLFNSKEKMQCKSSCCLMNEKQQKSLPSKKQSKDCGNDVCNPFMSCCNCYALTKDQLHFSAPFVYAQQKFSSIVENSDSDFLSNAWHPPKNV